MCWRTFCPAKVDALVSESTKHCPLWVKGSIESSRRGCSVTNMAFFYASPRFSLHSVAPPKHRKNLLSQFVDRAASSGAWNRWKIVQERWRTHREVPESCWWRIILHFLQTLLQKKLFASNFMVYTATVWAMHSSGWSDWEGLTIRKIGFFLESNSRTPPPPTGCEIPLIGPTLVLEAVRLLPFEPLEHSLVMWTSAE